MVKLVNNGRHGHKMQRMWPSRKPSWPAQQQSRLCSVWSTTNCRPIRRHASIASASWSFCDWAWRTARRVWQLCQKSRNIWNVWTLHGAWPWHRWANWPASIGPTRVQLVWVCSGEQQLPAGPHSRNNKSLIKIRELNLDIRYTAYLICPFGRVALSESALDCGSKMCSMCWRG